MGKNVMAQSCPLTSLGQRPSTAFPVCGVDTFSQATVPICENNSIPVPGCENTGVTYTDKNPFWYKFTCYQTGTLGFLITPNDLGDDYDWQIFDITGHNDPNDIYTDASLFVVGNWAGTFGLTGTSSAATTIIQCASDPANNVTAFSKMPLLQQGHVYLLLVSHFTDSQSGYQLSFAGGTAIITDPTDPNILSAYANCDGSQLTLILNKKMKCTSLAVNGSDFRISDSTVSVASAVGIGCSSGFDLDSVVLTLSNPLDPGNYVLSIQNGTDRNSLLDNCNRNIPVGVSVNFTIFERQPTPLDSLMPVGCAPKILQLPFQKNIRCSSIAANGSDFTITGPSPVTIISANGSCDSGLSKVINLNLSSPVVHAGTYTIELNTGTDGNSIIDECGSETPEGATISFSVQDTVSADFTYELQESCRSDSVHYFNNGGTSITQWNWMFDSILTSTEQNPIVTYSTFGNKTAQLIVTNNFCSDTIIINFYLNHDSLTAAFIGPDIYCPNDVAIFKDTSIGNIIAWNWEFGNGSTSTLQNPSQQIYQPAEKDRLFPVRLIVESDNQCTDTAVKFIKVVNNCFIAVPTAFTPNKDGRNDYLYPLNAYKATNLMFKIFNKYGQQLFETSDWTHKWDGTFRGTEQASGVYIWMLQYTESDTGKKIFQKGSTVLIR